MNNVVLVGRITADPEVQTGKSGTAYCRFTIACDRFLQDGADFIRCVAFGKTAENLGKYVGKGSIIGVNGSIQTGSYDGQDGKKVYTTEVTCNRVQFIDTKRGGQAPAPRPMNNAPKQNNNLSGINVNLNNTAPQSFGSESISFDPDPVPANTSDIDYDDIPWD